jgi:predicted aconitase with swiveling domain
MTEGRTLVAGRASGDALVLDDALSFWGGVDPATGDVIDPHHPQRGANIAGRVLVIPGGRGSSSSSTVLAEALRAGVGPAAIVLTEPDAILALGAIVARELYGVRIPVVECPDPPAATTLIVDADDGGATVLASPNSMP